MALQYLSDAWVDAADELLDVVRIDPPLAGPSFTVETALSDRTDRRYVVEFSGDRVRARRPRSGETATVRFTQTEAIAGAVAVGAHGAQAAFLDADIQVSGDVSTLIRHAGLVATLGDVLAPLRLRTEFDGGGGEGAASPAAVSGS